MKASSISKILPGPLLGIGAILLPELSAEYPQANLCLGMLLWMAGWWIMEPVPLGVTGLLPLAFFPFLGIMTTKEVAPLYGHHITFLFVGGFLIAYGMERWGLHERIALKLINMVGHSTSRLLAGFMLSSFLLSMWISNTATTVMLMAPALATIGQIEQIVDNKDQARKFSVFLLLSVAYTSSIGGMSTLVGTPPNLIFLSTYEGLDLPIDVNFLNWMSFAFPISITFLVVTFFYFRFCTRHIRLNLSPAYFQKRFTELGPMTFEQKAMSIGSIVLALLWMTRKDIRLDDFVVPGWHGLFPDTFAIHDSSVALAVAALLFAIPSKNQKGQMLLGIKELERIPFNIIFMFGGGFALAKAFVATGLGEIVANQLHGLQGFPPWIAIFVVSFIVLFLTEVSSNSPTVQLMLPVLVPLATVLEMHPLALMLPATIAASYAFMLPISTPPNAIIFESGKIPVRTMMRYGFWLNMIGLVILNVGIALLGPLIFGY